MLNRQTLPDQAADVLRRQILAGDWTPGQRLPPERELAETLGVNRVTLRTALSRLVANGLITQVQGRGTTVCDPMDAAGPDLLPALTQLAAERGHLVQTARELLRVRRHLAGALLERLVEVRPDPTPVRAAIERFAVADDLAAADADILAALIHAADSPVLALCLNPIRQTLPTLGPLADAMYRDPAANVQGWNALATWLDDPHPAGVAVILELLAHRDRETLAALEAA